MTNYIEVPYVAHIVADVDDTDDVAPAAWSRRRVAAARGAALAGLVEGVRRTAARLRVTPLMAMLLLVLALVACSDTSGPPKPNEPVATVAITPAPRTLVPGEVVQLSAVARDAAGQALPGRSIAWSSSSEVVAAVSATGLVTGVAPGEATIAAVVEGVTATAVLRVAAPGGGDVDRVELSDVALSMEEGSNHQLTATARDVSGNVVAGRVVQWTSADPGIATVVADGTVTGVRSGAVIVRAKIDATVAEATVRITTKLAFDLVFEAWEPFVGSEVYYQDFRDAQAASRRLFIPGRWATDPAPAPNGRKVAFVVTPYSGNTDLFIGSIDGEPFVRLTEGRPQDDQPAWSPDGRRIAFRRYTAGTDAGRDVWVIDAETRIPNNLTPDQHGIGQGSPAWSPDGTRIAYTHTTGSASHIWTMRADGSDKRQVTTGDVYDDEPAWSPDGTTLAFTRSATAIFGDLFLVNADGGNLRKLMPFVDLAFDQFAPAWSPDGRLIAFTSKHEGGPYQVYTVWADGSKLARRTSGAMNKESPAWIPREVIIWYQALTRE